MVTMDMAQEAGQGWLKVGMAAEEVHCTFVLDDANSGSGVDSPRMSGNSATMPLKVDIVVSDVVVVKAVSPLVVGWGLEGGCRLPESRPKGPPAIGDAAGH